MARKKIYIADNLPIKTINGTSVLGSGDITISGSSGNSPIYQGDIIGLGQSTVTSKVMYSQTKNIYYSFEAGKLRTSNDFETWSRPVSILPSLDFIAVYEINAHFFVAITYDSVYTSTDMLNWTLKSSPSIKKLSYSETHYVALGNTSNTILISTDLISWTTITINTTLMTQWVASSIYDIIYDGIKFIICGGKQLFAYSLDNGTTWLFGSQSIDRAGQVNRMTIFKGVYYATSYNTKYAVTNPISVSTDGINWTVSSGISTSPNLIYMTSNKDIMAVYGGSSVSTQNTDYLWISTDGINWTDKSAQLKAITNINNEYPVLVIPTDKALMIRASSGRLFKINKD